ncbi:glycoside hydrolase superfamily [Rhodofomes roseus]|uniref:Glycoside hydrolase superfamily n=1 Tax=Rhodofomes roseus TaxID=34475 RepID=A0ABQ8KPC4_9APHY|nr:glycoside hydrolase superfamily [Rhodofomes roseus]KAH9840270.1 glycoside hydrolase superfamily [Rhodofomes roseus]
MLFSFAHVFTALVALTHVGLGLAAPVPVCSLGNRTGGNNSTSSSGNATGSNGTTTSSSGPHWVVYSDSWVSGENGPPAASDIEGYNVFIMSFLLASGSVDQAQEWETLDATTRSTIKAAYKAAGVSLLVSAFGSTETPTSSGTDPTTAANTMAAWVKQYDVDGIDVDYEDFDAFNDGSAIAWLETFTSALRAQLPAGQYIITHAPVAPWFSGTSVYPSGSYLDIDQKVGSSIDWYNVQFYNQGASEYTDCNGLLTSSGGTFPGTSVFEIAAAGIDLNKIVIGKPASAADASNGYMDTATLASCVSQAQGKGWNAGVMTWEYPTGDSAWISAVRATAFPVN